MCFFAPKHHHPLKECSVLVLLCGQDYR
uniref:Uncharacterized protein n=1 Tax=Arundo donax TaxID=35708 RepID=A0A0A9HM25_ARUDO